MRAPIGNDGWYLCDWADLPHYEYVEFRGREAAAEQWLSQFHDDVFAWRTLRRLMGDAFPISDGRVRGIAAARLVTGFWKARRRAPALLPVGGRLDSGAGPAFPMEERRGASVPVSRTVPETSTYPDDIDAEAIAQAKKEAARLGIPFCEECLRARLAGR